jgi:hypothetical protein
MRWRAAGARQDAMLLMLRLAMRHALCFAVASVEARLPAAITASYARLRFRTNRCATVFSPQVQAGGRQQVQAADSSAGREVYD